MKVVITFTHKGWFGLCPVYLANVDSESPCVDPRHPALWPLFVLSELIFAGLFWLIGAVNPEYQAAWPLRVTGELVPHRQLDADW